MQRTKVNKTGNAWKKMGLKGSVPLGGGGGGREEGGGGGGREEGGGRREEGGGKRLHHPSLLPSCSGPAHLEKKETIH